jgi:hypothetical protein
VESGIGFMYQNPEEDKYTFENDEKIINSELVEQINQSNGRLYNCAKEYDRR